MIEKGKGSNWQQSNGRFTAEVMGTRMVMLVKGCGGGVMEQK